MSIPDSRESVGRVVVLTMGRVGSSSISRSLEAALGVNVPHIHSIDPDVLRRQVANAGSLEEAAASDRTGVYVAQSLRSSGRTKFVSLVREPIARNISAAFTSIRRKLPSEELSALLSDGQRVQDYWSQFYDQRPFNWFDREVRGVLGIDVFTSHFPAEGHIEFSGPQHDLMVMRAELPWHSQKSALESFVGIGGIDLVAANTNNRSMEEYQTFIDRLEFDEEYVTRVWNSKYVQHFYRDIPLDMYLRRWVRG